MSVGICPLSMNLLYQNHLALALKQALECSGQVILATVLQ